MAISPMTLVHVVGLKEQLTNFLASCFSKGYFQPENAAQFISPSLGFVPLNEENPYSAVLRKIDELAQVSGVNPKKHRGNKLRYDQKNEQWLEDVSARVSAVHKERKDLTEQLELCQRAMEQYEHFVGLDTPLESIFSCKYIKVRFGRLPKESYAKLALYSDNPYMMFIPCSETETDEYGAYFAPRHYSDEADRIFSSLFFERLWIPGAVGKPRDIMANLEENIAILKEQIQELDTRSREIWNKEGSRLSRVYSQLHYLSRLFDLRRQAVVHSNSFIYVGWIPEEKEESFTKLVEKIHGVSFEFGTPDSNTVVPVRLKNHKIFRPFEHIVAMFGLPSKSDLDLTPFVAIVYTAVFGLMFGDVGQGLVLVLIGLFMHFKMKNKLGLILTYSGTSATLAGFLYGSIFGFEDKLDFIYELFGFHPLHPATNINTLMVLGIVVGIFLMLSAMVINFISLIKNRKIGGALFGANGVAGMIFYISAVILAAKFMGAQIAINSIFLTTTVIISAALLFFHPILGKLLEGDKKPFPTKKGEFFMEIFFELFEYVLAYFSNTVSFLRVGAFVLVHGGMMMAVSAIAEFAGGAGLVVIILGNLFVIALETLFVSIQVMRLQFYEIFSRCYKGEGKAFRPVRL
ncbi:MAG: ATPase [Oscillospiraceae bacterium]|nr:ATPase [Oscillospiraceae bacterium]